LSLLTLLLTLLLSVKSTSDLSADTLCSLLFSSYLRPFLSTRTKDVCLDKQVISLLTK